MEASARTPKGRFFAALLLLGKMDLPRAHAKENAMKLPKVFFRKLLLGVVLVALAAGITMFIKETLDTRNPEASLPLITVQYGDEVFVQDKEVHRAGWEWNFFLTRQKTPALSIEDVPLSPVTVLPASPLHISFTKNPTRLRVLRAAGESPSEYIELADAGNGAFSSPTMPGLYYYKVQAEWQGRGFIQYYFALEVRDLMA